MAKRISLREFQQNLSDRLVSAGAEKAAMPCSASSPVPTNLPGGSRWLIDLADSGEVTPCRNSRRRP
jgi:hypothetical protein